MHKGRNLVSTPRREFLEYCGATATLIAATASVWAARSPGGDSEQTAKALRGLSDALDGDLLLPDDERFEPIRGISWNRMLAERRPDLIVMANTQADVVATLGFARDHDRRVAVRGGGHSWVASSVRQGGILLDVSHLNSIAIDAAAATASIGPGVSSAMLLEKAGDHGLSFPVAHCPSVPMSGFLLCGGHGWNFNRWGSACSNVTAVDLVLADGRELTATSKHYPDLFWAVRGAGAGFFGVITGYRLKLQHLPQAIAFSSYVFPGSAIGAATGLLDDLSEKLSRDVELFMVVGAPPADLSENTNVVCIVTAVAYTDSSAEAEQALKPLNGDPRVGQAISSTVNSPTDFDGLLAMGGGALPGGHRFLVNNIWLDDPLKEILVDSPVHYANAPSAKSHMLAVSCHPEFELKGTAHSMSKRYLVYNNTVWIDAVEDEANRAWHAGATALLKPYKAGRYIGEADLSMDSNVARECYSEMAWKRLRAMRATYDPASLFHDYLGTV